MNHGTASDWGGGDGVQIRETGKRLQQRGHEVDMVNSDAPQTVGYDLVHLFNCRTLASLESQMQACEASRVPVVLSPIWIDLRRALWGSRGTFGAIHQAVHSGATSDTSQLLALRERRLAVQLQEGFIQASGELEHKDDSYQNISSLLNRTDGLLPNSWLELQAVRSDLHWTGDCFEIAHYGVDPKLFLDANPEPFRQHSGIQGPFVMQAGRIEPAKNQAMLCWALKDTSLPIVLIGSTKNWPGCAELCRTIGGDKVHVIDHLPQELLASAYAAAAVHVLPTWMETCGLVTLEAALSGTPVVGSTFGHELEYLQNDAWYCDPANPESVHKAVIDAWQAGRMSSKALNLKRRVLSDYNWENTVDATVRLYERVLAQRKR